MARHTDGQTDNMKTVYPPPPQTKFARGITNTVLGCIQQHFKYSVCPQHKWDKQDKIYLEIYLNEEADRTYLEIYLSEETDRTVKLSEELEQNQTKLYPVFQS